MTTTIYQNSMILVVDDDPVNRLLTCQVLSHQGYIADEADSGESALQALSSQSYDLVLLDIIMPGLDGFEACRQIRAMPGRAEIPILIMTGLDDDESIRKAYDAGATDFITKPITWSLLGHRVRYMLRSSQAMQALSRSQTGLANAQRIAKMGSWNYNPVCGESYWSDEVFRILEIAPGANAHSYDVFLQMVHPEDRERVDRLYRVALRSGKPCEMEHRLLMPDNRLKWISFRGLPALKDKTAEPDYMVTIQDVTERKLAEDRVQFLAYYDELTGLPNRNLFQEILTKNLESARRYRRRLAVLMFNLNRFRRINETFGHTVGDLLLKQISELIRTNIRSSDTAARVDQNSLEFMRWSGDEFAIIATDLANVENAQLIAQRVLTALNQPCRLEGHELSMTACVGIAVYPGDGNSGDELVKNTQSALWAARKLGPNSCQFYTQAMNAHARRRLAMESDLRQALENNQFELFYQPLVKTDSFEIVSAEALLRWNHPNKGLIAPGEFIPLAEEAGLIVPIGEWALAAACAQNKAWQLAGYKKIKIAVNLSAFHFRKGLLLPHVQKALSQSTLDGQWINLEVTESVLMQDLDVILSIMEEIRTLGVCFSIDDFGTGYSSLSYLNRLPVQSFKIDQSFVGKLPDSKESLAIIRAITALGHSLGMAVVAEGVETNNQAQILALEGVDLMQGYLFSRPVPATSFSELLAAEKILTSSY